MNNMDNINNMNNMNEVINLWILPLRKGNLLLPSL